MKWHTWMTALLGSLMFAGIAQSEDGSRTWQVHNRLKVEFDDNIRQETDGQQDESLKIVEELELHVNLNLDQTFVSVRYRPSFVYWFDRDEDDTDIHHALDGVLNHRFSPMFSVSVKDTFRFQELPELVERGLSVRELNDYIHNSVNVDANLGFSPNTSLRLSGRHLFIAYDDATIAEREDFDIVVLGVTLHSQVNPQTGVNLDFRYEDTEYDSAINRNSQSLFAGVSADHSFSQNVIGDLRAGWQQKELEEAVDDKKDSPYAQVSLTFLPTPDTRFAVGGGYSQYEAYVFPYKNQDRLRAFVSLTRDLSAKLSWFNTLSYTKSEYDANELAASAQEFAGPDGEEDVVRFGSRLSYRVNRANWLEAGYNYLTYDSEVRSDYDRNRVSVAWKTQL